MNAPPQPQSRVRLRLWLRILKVTRTIEGQLRERFRTEFATTLPRFDVMAALAAAPDGLRMSEVSGALRVSNGNVTGIVDRLLAEGLVARETDPQDRRVLRVRLTAAGIAAFEVQAAAHAGWIDDLLSDAQGARAERLLADLTEIARQPDKEAP